VHIADVSHFVRPGGDLDQEARERGNSVYFPDKVIPMLPEQLSNGVCSLQPGRPRLTFSAFLTVDAEGQVVGRRVEKTLILSSARLTYEQVMEILAGPPGREGGGVKPAVADLLRRLNDLAVQFRARRMAHHALDLDLPECEVVLTPDGRMTGIRRVESDASHQLIEECMVAANEAVALELAHRQAPLISRLHEPPADDKIEDLTVYLGGLGLKPGDLSRPSNLSAFLRSMKGQPLGDHVKTAVLRSQKRAQYSAEAAGHFGLAKKHYAHFTSPIRRYPDLVVHRQLAATLVHHPRDAGEEEAGRSVRPARRLPYGMEELIAIARHCSQTEERAEEAERAVLEIKKYRFLSDQLAAGKPEVYEAAVVTVTNFGMFVEVPSLQIQGLVHISTMSDGFVTYNRQSHSLRAGKLTFRPAQKIRVFVSGVDFDKRHIDFRLA